jgi:hypothetical protein
MQIKAILASFPRFRLSTDGPCGIGHTLGADWVSLPIEWCEGTRGRKEVDRLTALHRGNPLEIDQSDRIG